MSWFIKNVRETCPSDSRLGFGGGNHINVSLSIRIFVTKKDDGSVLHIAFKERFNKKSNYLRTLIHLHTHFPHQDQFSVIKRIDLLYSFCLSINNRRNDRVASLLFFLTIFLSVIFKWMLRLFFHFWYLIFALLKC